jgi:hypothetical protein
MPGWKLLPRIFYCTDIVREQYLLSHWQLDICTLYSRFLLCDTRNESHMHSWKLLPRIFHRTDIVRDWIIFYCDGSQFNLNVCPLRSRFLLSDHQDCISLFYGLLLPTQLVIPARMPRQYLDCLRGRDTTLVMHLPLFPRLLLHCKLLLYLRCLHRWLLLF